MIVVNFSDILTSKLKLSSSLSLIHNYTMVNSKFSQ
jgi:hypothetical protein